ncbi:MAG: DNA cytosine methyltransferase [Gammaproteobacteria bacterium]
MITVNSYFSGAGLMDIGLIESGLRVNQSFEIDSSCCRVQRENLGHEVVECDIGKKLVLDEQDCDAMVFTYPCTKYSRIADIHGVRTGDELFLHALRHMAIKLAAVTVDQISRDDLTGTYQARLCQNQKEAAWHPLSDDSRQWVKLVKSINKKINLPKLAKGESIEV